MTRSYRWTPHAAVIQWRNRLNSRFFALNSIIKDAFACQSLGLFLRGFEYYCGFFSPIILSFVLHAGSTIPVL